VALAAGLTARAQFSSGVNLVEVYASVTDDRGEPVKGLTQADFELRENGELQTISTFSAGDFPLTVALALDRSFSMAGERLAASKSAARAFLDELRPEDEVTLLGVGSQVEILAPLSTDRRAQYAALDRVDAFGTTGLHDAIIRAIEVTQPGKGRRALVILSDGNDRYSTASADSALARARASDVMVYPVGFGAKRPPLFAELATLTGGRSYQLKDPSRLTETLRALARELREQYLLGYSPAKTLVAGSNEWRSISVSVKGQRLRVRARDGYQVK
jgi:Ca-activated chloride channel homolog